MKEVEHLSIVSPKLKPCVAIRALLTMIIPTDVTTLNIHAPASNAAFLSALLPGATPILSCHVGSNPIFQVAESTPAIETAVKRSVR